MSSTPTIHRSGRPRVGAPPGTETRRVTGSALPALTWQEVMLVQGGALARRQGLRLGLSGDAWTWRLDRKQWQSPLPGVALAHTGTVTFLERVWVAVLYGGDGAAVSGDALLHVLSRRWPEPSVVDVAVAPACQRAPHEFFRPHRVQAAGLVHPARHPPQLRAAPAVLHSAAWATTDRAAEWRVAAAVQQRLVTVPQLRSALEQLPRLRRSATIRLVLDDVELGAHARTELDFLAFLRRNRLPLPDRLQFKVRANGVRYLDAWWERQRVAAEVDGTHHMEVGSWDADTLRANELLVAQRHDRVMLLRVTAGNLRRREADLAAQFRAVLVGGGTGGVSSGP
ncbi:MAG: hypothetical protein JWP11_318 [Frankiales bacterium]|nr:hypothetical protein [Frankiales bacterium]